MKILKIQNNQITIFIVVGKELWKSNSVYQNFEPFISDVRIASYMKYRRHVNPFVILKHCLHYLVAHLSLDSNSTIVVEASGANSYHINDLLIRKIYKKMSFDIVAHGTDRTNENLKNCDKLITTLLKTTLCRVLDSKIENNSRRSVRYLRRLTSSTPKL